MKAIWLTDVHMEFLDERAVSAFLRELSRWNADAVLISGDIARAPGTARPGIDGLNGFGTCQPQPFDSGAGQQLVPTSTTKTGTGSDFQSMREAAIFCPVSMNRSRTASTSGGRLINILDTPRHKDFAEYLAGRVAPEEERFTGFVFKMHANLDPRHRDRIAFLRV